MDRNTGRYPSQGVGQALPCIISPHSVHPYRSFKNLDRLFPIGVLTKINRSEWAALSFIIPKKYNRVIFISDFRRLNKQIKRTPYPILNIKDMLNKLYNFSYATTLYLIFGYYNISLTDAVNKVYTITTPFGKYK